MSDYKTIDSGICPECNGRMRSSNHTENNGFNWYCDTCSIKYHFHDDPGASAYSKIRLNKQRYDDSEVDFPLGYLSDNCNDWNDFCNDVGLNPWLLNEGLAQSEDTHPVKINVLRKHGILV